MKVAKRIFAMLFEDFHWKLLAVFVAGVIWFVGVNMSDPYQNLSVSPRLRLDNLDIMAREGIAVLNEDDLRDINVSVTVRALRSDMDALRAALADPERFANFIEVSVDFRAVDSDAVRDADGIVSQSLRVSPNLMSGFEHLSINPAYIEVYLDTTARQMFPVQTVLRGDVPPGFELQPFRLGNESVTITGSRTDLREIASVRAEVDITGVHEAAELVIPLVVLDAEGYDITYRVQLNVTETTAPIRVWQIRTVPVFVRATGSPAAGFAVAEISGGLESVYVVAPAEILDNVDYILAGIDLDGASANVVHTILIAAYLPEGVALAQNEYEEMTITARIEPIEERVFIVPHGNVRSRGVVGLYQLVDDNAAIRVVISGPRSIIAALNASQIEPEFDLRGLPIGVHSVPLAIELPTGLTLVGTPPTLLVQIHEPAAPEENNGEPEPPDEPENGYENGEDYYEYPEYPDDYEYPQGADDEEYYGEE